MNRFDEILLSGKEAIDVAIELCMYSMKTQIFLDGNKRAAVIYSNHYLIAHGQGFLVIPEEYVPEFKKMFMAFYEGEDLSSISEFLKKNVEKLFDQHSKKILPLFRENGVNNTAIFDIKPYRVTCARNPLAGAAVLPSGNEEHNRDVERRKASLQQAPDSLRVAGNAYRICVPGDGEL